MRSSSAWLHEFVDVVAAGLVDEPVDLQLPRPRLEVLRVVPRTVARAGRELVEVVVAGHVLVEARLFVSERALLHVRQLGQAAALRHGLIGERSTARRHQSRRRRLDELPARIAALE